MSRISIRRWSQSRPLAAALLGVLLAAGAAAETRENRRPVTASTFDARVIARSSEVPVVVEFYAEWCGYCRKLRPVLESLAKEYDGRAHFVRVDIDAEPEVAERFGVDGIPVVYVFDAGLPLARMEGAASRDALKEMVDGFTINP